MSLKDKEREVMERDYKGNIIGTIKINRVNDVLAAKKEEIKQLEKTRQDYLKMMEHTTDSHKWHYYNGRVDEMKTAIRIIENL